MSMARLDNCELMNICMIVDREREMVLVQHRTKKSWQGVAFPGGHVEFGEGFGEGVVREVREETGLEIADVRLAGIVHWEHKETHVRTVIACYKTDRFSGVLRDSNEGKNEWIPLKDLRKQPLAPWLDEQLAVFEEDGISELYYAYTDDENERPRAF